MTGASAMDQGLPGWLQATASAWSETASRAVTDGADDGARRRAAYRRERDCVAGATSERLVSLLGSDDELRRTAASDELLRRGAPGVSRPVVSLGEGR
jgi:hypothetical protein